MKLTTTDTKTTRTKTGTITVADLRKKFRIPAEATIRNPEENIYYSNDDEVVVEVTHTVEATK